VGPAIYTREKIIMLRGGFRDGWGAYPRGILKNRPISAETFECFAFGHDQA
jgi:hypothetical protein